MSERENTWVARFVDGPLADGDYERHFSVGPPWVDMWLIPTSISSLPWTIVHGDGFPPGRDIPPWLGQVHYRIVSVVDVNDAETIASYELVSDE
jgi:hypothetical protein